MGSSGTAGRPARLAAWLIYAASFVLVLGKYKDYVYSGSFDMALHYDLVHSIYHNWGWPRLHPLWSTMHLYPPLAHYLAAIIGVFVRSPLVGMNTLAMASIFASYAVLARAVGSGSLISAAVAALVAVVGLKLGRDQTAVEGFETLYNYFFAQMVGDCVFLLFAAWLAQTRRDWRWRLAAAAAATFVLGWLYMQTSVLVALTYIGLEGLLLLRKIAQERALRWVWSLPFVLGLVVLPLIIVLHPEFQAMRGTASNDGSLPLGALVDYMPHLAGALILGSLVLGMLTPAEAPWRRGGLFLAAAGLAAGAACLAQFLALVLFKAGSSYAVRKYGFADVTLLVFVSAALAGVLIDRGRAPGERPVTVAIASSLAGLAAIVFLPVSNVPGHLAAFADYQRKVDAVLARPDLPAEARHHIVSKNPDFAASVNHVETMVDLAMNPNESLLADSYGIGPSDPTPATWAFMADPTLKFPKNCLAPGSRFGFMVLAKLNCVRDWPLAPHQPVVLTDMKFLPKSFASGWSGNEGNGVWTLGKEAVYKLHLDHPTDPVRLTFSGPVYRPHDSNVQRVQLYVGDKLVGGRTFDSAHPDGDVTAVIPAALLKNGDADVVIKLPDATSPAEQKVSGDVRLIAYFVTSVSLDK